MVEGRCGLDNYVVGGFLLNNTITKGLKNMIRVQKKQKLQTRCCDRGPGVRFDSLQQSFNARKETHMPPRH